MSDQNPTDSDPITRLDPDCLGVNPLFQKLDPKADDTRNFVILVGYVGRLDAHTVWIYPSLDLSFYLVVPRAAIQAFEPVDPLRVLSPTRFVVDAATEVKRVKVAAPEAGFLAGPIVRNLASSAKGEMSSLRGVEARVLNPCNLTYLGRSFASATTIKYVSGVCVVDEPFPGLEP